VAVFEAARGRLLDMMMNCSSGREVSERGFEEDVRLAAEVDVSTTVPRLHDGAFLGAET
jgi:2-phosphosulfolactate phosphatase